MRPILKSGGRKRSPNKSPSASTLSPQAKRQSEFTSPSGRRVTFSPFAKPRRRLQPKRLEKDLEEGSEVLAGFASNALAEREKTRQARRKHEMGILQSLNNAARKPRLSWLALVEDHLTFLKTAHVKVSHWLHVIKKPFMSEARRRRNHRILRSRIRHAPPVFFDQRDRQYLQSVNAPLLPHTRVIAIDHTYRATPFTGTSSLGFLNASEERSPLVEPRAVVQPSLTPVHYGSLSSLLRREGIPATEDEWREQAAVRNDLRGVTHRSTGLKIVPHDHQLRVV